MDTFHIALGLAVTVAGLVAAMSFLLAVSKLVDLASRQRGVSCAGTADGSDAAIHGVREALPDAPGDGANYGSGDHATDAPGATAREAATDSFLSGKTPARSRSLHLHLRVAGRDYDVEVQQVGQAA